MRFVAHERGILTSMGFIGHLIGSGEPAAWIGCDIPTNTFSPLTKEQAELQDVEEAIRLELSGVTSAKLESVSPGPHPNDPPDVIATLSDGDLACETFQLQMPAVRGSNNVPISRQQRFEKLRQSLLAQSATLGGKVRQHRNFVVYVWFGDPLHPESDHLPRQDDQLLLQLLQTTVPPTTQGPVWKTSAIEPVGHVAWNVDRTIGLTWSSLPKGYSTSSRSFNGL